MKTALILGITGGFGGHVAKALKDDDWNLKVMMRDTVLLPEGFKNVAVVQGDVSNIENVRAAMKGVDTVIYAINPANYAWKDVALSMLDVVATVAEEEKVRIVFPGNVYIYDPKNGPDFTEQSEVTGVTSKGIIRIEMEERLALAASRGAKVIILRMGDFIGKDAKSTWMKEIIKPTKKGYSFTVPGPVKVKHSYAYLPDAAKTVVELLRRGGELDVFSVFNFKGYQISFNDLSTKIEQLSGKEVEIKKFPWFIIKCLSPFSGLFKGLIEMRYLWQYELNLDETKLETVLKAGVPQTPINKALVESGTVK